MSGRWVPSPGWVTYQMGVGLRGDDLKPLRGQMRKAANSETQGGAAVTGGSRPLDK
jgi:hypothetical protein